MNAFTPSETIDPARRLFLKIGVAAGSLSGKAGRA